MSEFRLLIGSQPPQWGESLAAAFAENILFEVAGSVTLPELIEAAVRFHPDVVLWKMEDEDPVPLATELQRKCPVGLPVVLVDNPQKLDLAVLLRAGVRGCLPIRLLPRQIVHAVELIAKAGMLCLPRLGQGFAISPEPQSSTPGSGNPTGREREVLSLLGQNLSNQEIGRALFLSESTVKTHLRSIFRKLGARNRTEVLIAALRLGVLERKDFVSEKY